MGQKAHTRTLPVTPLALARISTLCLISLWFLIATEGIIQLGKIRDGKFVISFFLPVMAGWSIKHGASASLTDLDFQKCRSMVERTGKVNNLATATQPWGGRKATCGAKLLMGTTRDA